MESSSPLSVLVVDDEPSVVRQLVDGLTISGFQVSGAESAVTALDRLTHDPDIGVVVSDIRMPGLDGLALAKRIACERDEQRATEVIIITGHATVEDAAHAVRSRVSDFLRKPFRLMEASKAVATALDRAAARRQEAVLKSAQCMRLSSLEAQARAMQQELADAVRLLSAVGVPADTYQKVERNLHAISHASRTPLIAIAGGADLLRNPSGTAGAAEYLELLRAGVVQAREAVELLEELHRVDRPPPEGQRQSCALHERISHAAALFMPRAQERGIALSVSKLAPVIVPGVADRLQRAVEHCLAEALDWAQPGARINAVLEPVQTPGTPPTRWAVLTILVAPAGMASPPEPPREIAFLETTSIWSRTQEGLRFSIARRLAEQHGGRLSSWNGGEGSMALRLALPS
jgi:FixJ family two-component response regulator